MNNEPIPHKRRRRQPTVDSASNIEVQGNSDAKGSNSKAQSAAKYAKKAPKPAVKSTDEGDANAVKIVARKDAEKATAPARAKKSVKATTAKAAKAKQDMSDQMPAVKVTDNKGPVPSKRRRRQPSTESA
jgi:poly(A) polymerase